MYWIFVIVSIVILFIILLFIKYFEFEKEESDNEYRTFNVNLMGLVVLIITCFTSVFSALAYAIILLAIILNILVGNARLKSGKESKIIKILVKFFNTPIV